MRRIHVFAVVGLLVLTLGVAACGDSDSPTSPSPSPAPSPTPTPTPIPTPTPTPEPTAASLSGTVSDTGGGRIGGATVTVLDGTNAGQSAQANSNGEYQFASLPVANANLVATASGYIEDRRGTFVNGSNTLNFTLTPEPPPPPPVPTLTIASSIVSGGPGTAIQEWRFTATSNVTISSYDWDFGDGVTATGSGAIEQHVYRTRDTFTVTVTGHRPDGSTVEGELEIEVE